MPDDNAKLLIVLEAQSKKLQNQLADATKTIDRFAAQTNRRFDAMNSKNAASFEALNRKVGVSLGAMQRGIGAAFAGAAALRGAQQLIDASTRIENSLKVAGLAGEELDGVYDALADSARRNGTSFEALATLYGRTALVQKELGVTADDLAKFTDNVALALRVAGTDAGSASGALLQLSQAMGAGVVRAEEFNSILEGAPTIAQAAAAGITEAGGSVAKLRQLVIEGKISSDILFRGFEAGAVILRDKVAGSTFTVSQQFDQLRTVLITTAGQFDEATGASRRIGGGLSELATAIQNVGDYFERNAGRIKPFFDAIAAGEGFDRVAFRKKLGLGVIDDFLEGTSLIEGRFGLASQQIVQDASAIEAELLGAMAAMIGLNDASQFSPEQLASFQALIVQMEAGEGGADELRAALIEMGASPVNFMIAFSGLSGLIDKLRETRGEAIATAAAVATAAAQTSDTNIAGQRSEQFANRPKAPIQTVSITDSKIPLVPPGGSKQSPVEKFDDVLKKQAEENRLLAEKTALQATLNPLVNDYGFAIEKLNVAQELQTAATAAGLELTPELKAKIDELATGYANASVEAAKLAQSQDQLKEISDDFGEAGKSAIKGFISDLIEGKSAADALGNAMSSILDKVIDIGLNLLLGGLGGGGGGIGALFGFAKGGLAANGKPMKGFAKGGVSSTAAIFGEAGPEAAVPLPDGRRIPVDLRMPTAAAGKQQGGALRVHVSLDSDLLQAQVTDTAGRVVAAAAPTIIRRANDSAPAAVMDRQTRFGGGGAALRHR